MPGRVPRSCAGDRVSGPGLFAQVGPYPASCRQDTAGNARFRSDRMVRHSVGLEARRRRVQRACRRSQADCWLRIDQVEGARLSVNTGLPCRFRGSARKACRADTMRAIAKNPAPGFVRVRSERPDLNAYPDIARLMPRAVPDYPGGFATRV